MSDETEKRGRQHNPFVMLLVGTLVSSTIGVAAWYISREFSKEGEVAALKVTVDQHSRDIDQLKGDGEKLRDEIQKLREDVGTIKTNVAVIRALAENKKP